MKKLIKEALVLVIVITLLGSVIGGLLMFKASQGYAGPVNEKKEFCINC
jgi:nitrate/TMAO reductase-like tetraheme cytochrome c subunit